jgi:hydrogenase maturation protein HypF
MPGGDQAIREPWRMAIAHLADAGRDDGPLADRLPPGARRTVRRMVERRFNTALTSSAGRLFDAVASLAGVRDRASYEGQAAAELEALAAGVTPCGTYPFEITETGEEAACPEADFVVDTRPLTRAVADDTGNALEPATIARRFHSTLVELIVAVCRRLRANTGVDAVVLSGGVFMNAVVTSETCGRLRHEGLRVYRHRLVPPNDGGLSLGQLAIAACHSNSAGPREAGGRF